MSSGSPWSPEEESVLWDLVEPHIETIIKASRGYKKLWEQVLIDFRSHTNRLGEKFPQRSQRAIEQRWKLLYLQRRTPLQMRTLPVVEAVPFTATSSALAPRTPPTSTASFSASNPQSTGASVMCRGCGGWKGPGRSVCPNTECESRPYGPSTGPSAAPSATPSPVGAGVVKRVQEAECFFYGEPSEVTGLANKVAQMERDAGIVPQEGKIDLRICAIEQWIQDAGS